MEGLLMKYFVLNPNKSDWHGQASRAAIRSYASTIDGEQPRLARDLRAWLVSLEPKAGLHPRIGAIWPEQSGIYAGLARGRDGDADYHLVVSEAEQSNIKWQAAMDWAKGLEAAGDLALPTRAEQALLFANVPELFAKEWYWSCEQFTGDAQYAWYQTFDNGGQNYYLKSYELRARAVRRVPIE